MNDENITPIRNNVMNVHVQLVHYYIMYSSFITIKSLFLLLWTIK